MSNDCIYDDILISPAHMAWAGFEISVKKKIRSFSTEISLKFH